MVRTLTLYPGAVYSNVCPVVMVWSCGTIEFGAVGVLLAVFAPVKTWAVPVVGTNAKGRTNVMEAAAPSVFDTYLREIIQ